MPAKDSQDVKDLRVIEELLDRSPNQRSVDTSLVLQRMGLDPTPDTKVHNEMARRMSQLKSKGLVEGKVMTGDGKVMDVTVTAITEAGRRLLK